MQIKFILAWVVFAMVGCTGSKVADGPKGVLQEYIHKSFNLTRVEDRRDLERLLTGKAKLKLSTWSDEQFRGAFLIQKRTFKNLLIKEEKSLSPNEVNITYELTYIDGDKGPDTKVTQRKLAQVVKEGDLWLIGEVRNIKELIEYQNEMSLP